jgi:hypothetical protein
MDFDAIYSFIDTTSARLETIWQIRNLSTIAGLRVPDVITGKQDSIIRADINLLWTQWFLESICDPDKFVELYPCYRYIVHVVKNEIPVIFTNVQKSKQDELIKQISRLINNEVKQRQFKKRANFDIGIKQYLWDVYGPELRCWICGYKFSDWAIDKFLEYQTSSKLLIPQFIDYVKPHGLSKRDFQVEIDHVFPFSKGGKDSAENLRLACGWCNSQKSEKMSIYDVAAKPPTVLHPTLGKVSVPHPFWVVRLLSLRRNCEHEDGCNKSVENCELTVTSRHFEGAMNPLNLRVTCLEHDSLGSKRFVSRTLGGKIWKKQPFT